MKICNKCKIEKSEFDFKEIRCVRTGRLYYERICKKCKSVRTKQIRRRSQLRYKYGLEEVQIEIMLKTQNNCCAICNEQFTISKKSYI